MTRSSGFKVGMGIAVAALAGSQNAAAQAPTLSVDPSRLPRLGTVDARFQSYNVEMVEVTGGRFWKPYRASASAPSARGADNSGNIPAGANPDLYAYREPIDLSNPRLRALAAALAPAYMRVSGTWANTTYFAESDDAPSTPPNGFRAVLSRERWKAVIDFAHAVNAEIVTSMATSPGARDAAGRWQSDQARRLFAYTRSVGGRIAAAEFMNEPTLAAMGGAPDGYDAAAYGRDFKAFAAFMKDERTGCDGSGPRFDRRDGSAAIIHAVQLRIHLYAGLACSIRPRHRRFFLSSLRRGLATMRSGSNHARGRAFGSVAGEHGPDACVLPIAQGRICA